MGSTTEITFYNEKVGYIFCMSNPCQAAFAPGSKVIIEGRANYPDSSFLGWRGGTCDKYARRFGEYICSVSVTMDSTKNKVATFNGGGSNKKRK
jgi:hypothetical protein